MCQVMIPRLININVGHRDWSGWLELQAHRLPPLAHQGPLESERGNAHRVAMRVAAVQLGRDDRSRSSKRLTAVGLFARVEVHRQR